MVESKQYEDFKKFVLKSNSKSKDKITIPINILSEKLDSVIKESAENQVKLFIEFVQIEYERANQNYELSEHTGKDKFQKELEKFKQEFLYDLKKKLSK